MFGVAGLLIWGLWLGVSWLDRDHRETAEAAGVARGEAAALAADVHLRRFAAVMDRALVHLADQWAEAPDAFDRRAAALTNIVRDALVQVTVIGPEGTVLFSDFAPQAAGQDLSDREYFTVHRDGAVDGLFVSKPVLSSAPERWSVEFTRRLSAPDGGFGGVMVLSVDPEHMAATFMPQGLGDGSTLTLVGLDGVIRARNPAIQGGQYWVGQTVPPGRPFLADNALQGWERSVSISDGIPRYFFWHRNAALPLVSVVQLQAADLYTGADAGAQKWRRLAWAGTLLVLIAAAALMVVPLRVPMRSLAPSPRVLAAATPASVALRRRVLGRFGGFSASVKVVAGLAILAQAGTIAGLVFLDRRNTLIDAEAAVVSQARVVEAFLTRVARGFDLDVQQIRRQIERSGGGNAEAIRDAIAVRMETTPEIMDVLVLDAQGRITHWNRDTARPDVSDRAYFTAHRDGVDDVLHVSRPMESRVHAGRYFFSVSRRLSGPDGAFAGAVVVIVDIGPLVEVMGDLLYDPGASALVATLDGVALFRYPRNAGGIGMVVPDIAALGGNIPDLTTLHVTSPFDGRRRIVGRVRLSDYPLVVAATVDKDAVLAERRPVWWAGLAVGGALGLAILAAALLLLRAGRARYAAVEALETERQRLRNVIDGTSVGTWEWNVQTGEVVLNDRWAEIIGHRLDDLAPITVTTWSRLIHPDDLRLVRAQLARHFSGKTDAHDSEVRMRHKDGHWVWVLIRGKVMSRTQDGSAEWMSGTTSDISERKVLELALREVLERMQKLASHLPGMIFQYRQWPDGSKAFPYSSDGIIEIYGVTPKDVEADATPAYRALHPDDLEKVVESVALSAETLAPWRDQHRVNHPTRGLIWAEGHATPERQLDGSTLWHGYIHDITARKTAELSLEEERHALRRSNTDLEQFAYVASHDLRQPLRMITSYGQLLERSLKESLGESEREFLGYISDGARRMDQMLVALLEYSRIGRQGEPMTPVDSRALAGEAVKFLEPLIAETGGQVRLHGDWPMVMASYNEGVRLFQNLIGNALKYRAPDRAPQVDLAARSKGAFWEFTITDNGIGIDPTQINRLFKVFQRLHTRTAYEGTGIGLAVCRKIVERHGGTIGVESEGEGMGTTLRFTLPAG